MKTTKESRPEIQKAKKEAYSEVFKELDKHIIWDEFNHRRFIIYEKQWNEWKKKFMGSGA